MATPTSDPYSGRQPDLGTPTYSGAFAITPGAALPVPTRALIVSGAGAISVVDMYGVTTVIQITANIAGMILPLRVSVVNSSGTTATNIVGLI
jgi:hypothetical protein